MKSTKVLLYTVMVLFLLTFDDAVGRRVYPLPPCKFPAVYNFGDSNSDTGGISAVFEAIPPPYGDSFFGKPAGRECDGRLIIDFIAEHLGLPYLSSYLDSIESEFRRGANFAAGASTIRSSTNQTIFQAGICPFSLDIQILHFHQFKSRTFHLYNQSGRNDGWERSKQQLPRPNEFSKALYTFDIGQNDLVDGLNKLTRQQLIASFPHTVDQLAAAITNLYEQGARTFWIHNVGPIGCLPAATLFMRKYSTPAGTSLDQIGCIRYHNSMAARFNALLKARVSQLRRDLPRASLVYVDVYSAKYHLLTHTSYYGFVEPMKICCGRLEEGGAEVWCGQRGVVNGSEVMGGSCV